MITLHSNSIIQTIILRIISFNITLTIYRWTIVEMTIAEMIVAVIMGEEQTSRYLPSLWNIEPLWVLTKSNKEARIKDSSI